MLWEVSCITVMSCDMVVSCDATCRGVELDLDFHVMPCDVIMGWHVMALGVMWWCHM